MRQMANTRKFEKSLWFSLLELSLVIIGFIATLPTAFLMAFVVLVYFMVGTALVSTDLSKLTFKRKLSKERINDEEELTVEETIRNDGKRPIFLEVSSPLQSELLVSEGSNHYLIRLRGKEARRIRYKIKPLFFGNFTVRKTTMRTLNCLLSSFQEVEKESPAIFSVFPVLEELRKFPFGRMSVRPIQGVITSESPGHGTEFFEIRDYSSTDDFRRINWKASARAGKLLSNEHEWERMADIYIVLDSTSSSAYFLSDYIRGCVSLADLFLRMGNRVGLVVMGKFWTWIRSGSGRRQLVRLAESLIEERPEDPITQTYQVESTMRVVPRVSTLIILSPMRNKNLRELVRRIVDRRQRVMAMIPECTASYLKPQKTDPRWVTISRKLVLFERENALKFLKALGVPVTEWDPKHPLSNAVEALERWTTRQPIATT
jgi:uncharacterized protein (DUF58 family)